MHRRPRRLSPSANACLALGLALCACQRTPTSSPRDALAPRAAPDAAPSRAPAHSPPGAFPTGPPRHGDAPDALPSDAWIDLRVAPDRALLALLSPRVLEVRDAGGALGRRWSAALPGGLALAFEHGGARLAVLTERPGQGVTPGGDLSLRLFDAPTGRALGEVALPAWPALPANGATLQRAPERVVGLEPGAGDTQWTVWTTYHRGEVLGTRVLWTAGVRSVSLPSQDGRGALTADVRTGDVRAVDVRFAWPCPRFVGAPDQSVLPVGALDVASGTTAIACGADLHWIDARTGTRRLTSELRGEAVRVALRSERSAVALERLPGAIERVAVTPEERRPLWGLAARWAGVALWRGGDLMAAWSTQGELAVLSLPDGVVRCTHAQLPPAGRYWSAAFGLDGTLYALLGDAAGGAVTHLASIDGRECALRVATTAIEGAPEHIDATETGRLVFAGGGTVWSRALADTSPRWSHAVDPRAPMQVDRAGTHVLVREPGRLVVLDADDGRELGAWPLSGRALQYARLCADDGVPSVLVRGPGVPRLRALARGAPAPDEGELLEFDGCADDVAVHSAPDAARDVVVLRGEREVARRTRAQLLGAELDRASGGSLGLFLAPDGRALLLSTAGAPWQWARW